jgi:DNA mismatch repair protein MutS
VFSSNSQMKVVGWRHPVVEKFLSHTQQFIPNDLKMNDDDSFHLITWPNMGGKSTYLRQNALIVLLWHVWLPVPAVQAILPVVDGIYARVGSWDAIAKNQSTFMTEMIEMANIINNASQKSFIVLDELGRWTSTYDGMALAHALSVTICELWVKTLFATHYHELITLEDEYTNFSNHQVSVVETDRDVVFMRKIIPWWADKSYWLHVARRAWIPDSIVDQAQQKLDELISIRNKNTHHQIPLLLDAQTSTSSESDRKKEECFNQLLDIDTQKMTPIDALVHLHQLKMQFLQITSTDS